jgi:ATP-dependent DNA ligase
VTRSDRSSGNERQDFRGIVSKKLNAPYKSGPSKAWLKIKNPKAPAATRVIDGAF